MLASATVDWAKAMKPRTQFGSPTWVPGTQVLWLSLLSPRVCISKGLGVGAELGPKPITLIRDVIEDADVPSGILTAVPSTGACLHYFC